MKIEKGKDFIHITGLYKASKKERQVVVNEIKKWLNEVDGKQT